MLLLSGIGQQNDHQQEVLEICEIILSNSSILKENTDYVLEVVCKRISEKPDLLQFFIYFLNRMIEEDISVELVRDVFERHKEQLLEQFLLYFQLKEY